MGADACHALGAKYKGRSVGTLAYVNMFSFHPVKHITTGEGGLVTTDDPDLAQRMRVFRNHGIATDIHQREKRGTWFYEMVDLGYNYRITDFQCALGISQLRRLPGWVIRRQEIARRYDSVFAEIPAIKPLSLQPQVSHAYHLYVVQLKLERLKCERGAIFTALRAEGIGVNVHYIPVHLHPYFRERYGTKRGDCPVVEAAYERLLTLPLYPEMSSQDVENVIRAVARIVSDFLK